MRHDSGKDFVGQLSGIIIPVVIGVLASGGNFAPALLFVAIIGLPGACCYIFLIGDNSRIVEKNNVAV